MTQPALFPAGPHIIYGERTCPKCRGPMTRPHRGGLSDKWYSCLNCGHVEEERFFGVRELFNGRSER